MKRSFTGGGSVKSEHDRKTKKGAPSDVHRVHPEQLSVKTDLLSKQRAQNLQPGTASARGSGTSSYHSPVDKSSQLSTAITGSSVRILVSNKLAVDSVPFSNLSTATVGTIQISGSNTMADDPFTFSTSMAAVSATADPMTISDAGELSPTCVATHGGDSASVCEADDSPSWSDDSKISFSDGISLGNRYYSPTTDGTSSSSSMTTSPDATDSLAIEENSTFTFDPVNGSTQGKSHGLNSKPVLDIAAVQPASHAIVNTLAHSSGRHTTTQRQVTSPIVLPTTVKGGKRFLWVTDRDFIVEPTIKITEVRETAPKSSYKERDTTFVSDPVPLSARFRTSRRFQKCSKNILKGLSICVTHIRTHSKIKPF
ncbi:hypothetical protein R1flu_024295 [Riccia fluitans]|uniref:Uncharacterized protein n=1 Tax=Riccia fluitans TaxID=41844 RepID=A0ABD1XVC1_9MARC